MARKYRALTPDQVDQFLTNGFTIITDAFSREFARAWTDQAWVRLGYDPKDPSTWQESKIHMPGLNRVEVREIAPKAWAAMCELCGGEERISQPAMWGDSFILNLSFAADRPWQPPSANCPGWHKDGDFFRHFLDSPEQGLLTIVIWSDINSQGGGTYVSCDSVGPVARFLAAHPEGTLPREFDFRSLIGECREFVEVTGRVGDVALIHPYVLHASSQNPSGIPRFITNPPISLIEPMRFDREDPDEFSLVELAVLRGLGVDKFSFQPTAPREKVVPERVARQRKMEEAERARLQASGVAG